MKRVSFLCALLALVGCRAAEPNGGSFRDLRVGDIRRSSPAAPGAHRVVSTNTDLQSLADLTTQSIDLQADVLGDIAWRFDGQAEVYNLNTLSHVADPHTLDDSLEGIGLLDDLHDELVALPQSVRALIPDFDEGEDSTAARPFFRHLRLKILRGRELRTFWDTPLPTGVPVPATGVPFVQLREHAVLRSTPRFWLRLLFRHIRGSATYAQQIYPYACGVPGLPACENDGRLLFRDYRTQLTTDGRDALLPEQGLDFSVTTGTTEVHANARTGLRCPVMLRLLLSVGFPAAPGGSAIVGCGILRRLVEAKIRQRLRDEDVRLKNVLNLMINPPSGRVTIKQFLASYPLNRLSRPDSCDMPSGPSACAIGEAIADCQQRCKLTYYDTNTSAGREHVLSRVLPLDPAFIERLAADDPANRTPVAEQIYLNGLLTMTVPDGAGGTTTLELTNPDGSFGDAAIQGFATGGRVSSTGGVVDVPALSRACIEHPSAALTAVCGSCADGTAPSLLCDGNDLASSPVTLAIPEGIAPTFRLGPSPVIAQVLSGAPLVAQTFREFFARPLPEGGRYIHVEYARSPRETHLDFIIDPDKDGIDVSHDNCPDDFNPAQADEDGDGLGDLCDLCPGVDNSGQTASFANGDQDGDGRPNGCDCDLDGDGCLNPGSQFGSAGPVDCSALLAMPEHEGETFQGQPFHDADVTPGDFDMDGTPNRCDADLDGDLVDNGVDNCPLGDGDAIYEPGIDDDPDQTDSGGPPQGDLCDAFCNSSGGPICGLAPGDFGPGAHGLPGALPPGASAVPYLPGIPAGSCLGFGCNIGGLMRCFGDQADRCLNFANDLSLRDGQLGRTLNLSTQELGLDAPFGAFRPLAQDLDGDGLGELIVSSPLATAQAPCSLGSECVPLSLPEAGRVLVLGSQGQVLAELQGEAAGEHLGQALALGAGVLAVGAPGAGAGAGSIRLFELTSSGLRERQRLDGAPGEGLGAAVALYDGSWPPIFLAAGGDEVVALDPVAGERARTPAVSARLSQLAVGRDAQGVPFVVAADPQANQGAGRVFFFGAGGQLLSRVDGAPGERLGSALVADARSLGADRVAVGAPGRNGDSGGVYLYDGAAQVQQTLVYWGVRVGTQLAAAGDTDGDGQAELWVSMDVNGQAMTVPWTFGN